MEFELALKISQLGLEELLDLAHVRTAASEIQRGRECARARVLRKLVRVQQYARHKQIRLSGQKPVGGQHLLQHFGNKLACRACRGLNIAYKRNSFEIRGLSVVVDNNNAGAVIRKNGGLKLRFIVNVRDYEQRVRIYHVHGGVAVREHGLVFLLARQPVAAAVKAGIVHVGYDIYGNTAEKAKSRKADGCAEGVEVRISVTHDEHVG